jgi:hypothetical protein
MAIFSPRCFISVRRRVVTALTDPATDIFSYFLQYLAVLGSLLGQMYGSFAGKANFSTPD